MWVRCGFVWFSYHKTALRTTQCSAVRLLHFAGSFSQFGCDSVVW